MGILNGAEQWLINRVEGDMPDHTGRTGDGFDEATDSSLDRLVLELRAASFDPMRLAVGVQNVCSPPRGQIEAMDVGCNFGAKSRLFLQMLEDMGCTDPRIIGIDLSEKAIELAKKTNNYPQIKYQVADFLEKDIEAGSLDYIFMAAVWHHISDTRGAVLKIEESLKPGGVGLIFNGYYPEHPVFRMLAIVVQKLYREIEKRHGVYYNRPLISGVRNLVRDNCRDLEYKGDFLAGGLSSILNTRMAVLQKIS